MKIKKFFSLYVAATIMLFSYVGYAQVINTASRLVPVISLLLSDHDLTPTVTASFSPDTVFAGQTSTLTITLTNPSSSSLTSVNIENDLPSGLTLSAAASSNTCDTTPQVTASGGIYNLTDTTIEANSDCVINIAVRGIDAADVGVKNFSTANFTAGTDVFDDASAMLTINNLGDPTVAAAFSPANIITGQPSTLTVTITNTDSVALTGISIRNDLPAPLTLNTGLSTNTCDNSPGINASLGRYNITNASIPANGTCVITIAVSGSSTTTPSVLGFSTSSFTNGSDTFNNASADLTITAPASPTVTAAFTPNTMFTNEVGTVLTVTLSNPNPGPLDNISITNDLPAGLGLDAGESSNTCDVTPAVNAANGVYNITDATLEANSDCVITIALTDIDIADAGVQNFSTSAYTDGSNTFSNASAVLTINAAPDPGVTASFSPSVILASETSVLTVRVTNPTSTPITNVNITNDLPSGLTLNESQSSATCDASPFFNAPQGIYNLTNATIPASTTCIITIAVSGISVADLGGKNFSTSSFTVGGTSYPDATATLGIFDQYPTITGVYDQESYEVGETGSVVFSLDNPGSVDLTGVNYSANLQGGFDLVEPGSSATCDATPSYTHSTNRMDITDATIDAGTTCTMTLNFIITSTSNYGNIWYTVYTDQGNFPGPVTTSPTLDPAPPLTITGVYDATSYEVGETGTVTFSINNPALIDYTGVNYSANLQGGYDLVETGSGVTCDATPDYTHSTNRMDITDATIDAGSTCTMTLNFIITSTSNYGNIWYQIYTDQGNFPGPVTTSPTLDPAPPLTITGVYDAASYEVGETGTVTFTIINPALIDYTGVNYSANLQGGYDLVETGSGATCDATPDYTHSTNRMDITDATIDAGTTCTMTMNFIIDSMSNYGNIWYTIYTDQGNFPGPVTTDPAITQAPAPTTSAVFSPTTLVKTQSGTLTITINNTSSADFTSVDFSADLPAGLNLTSASSSASCDASPLVDNATEVFGITNATINTGSTCTITINFNTTAVGSFTPALTDIVTSNTGSYAAPGVGSLVVTHPPAPTITGSFIPNPITVGDTADLVFQITNNASIPIVINEFGNELPPELPIVPKASTVTCDASPDEDPGSNVFYVTNATLSAGATCTVTIKYQAQVAETYLPNTGQVETNIGNYSVPGFTALSVDKP